MIRCIHVLLPMVHGISVSIAMEPAVITTAAVKRQTAYFEPTNQLRI